MFVFKPHGIIKKGKTRVYIYIIMTMIGYRFTFVSLNAFVHELNKIVIDPLNAVN